MTFPWFPCQGNPCGFENKLCLDAPLGDTQFHTFPFTHSPPLSRSLARISAAISWFVLKPPSHLGYDDVSEEHVASLFRVFQLP